MQPIGLGSTHDNDRVGIENLRYSCPANALTQLLVRIPIFEHSISSTKFPEYQKLVRKIKSKKAGSVIRKGECRKAMEEIGYDGKGRASPTLYLRKLAPSVCRIQVCLEDGERPQYSLNLNDVKIEGVDKPNTQQKLIRLTESRIKSAKLRKYVFIEDRGSPLEKVIERIRLFQQEYELVGLTVENSKHEMAARKSESNSNWFFYDDDRVRGPYRSFAHFCRAHKNYIPSFGRGPRKSGLLMYKKVV